MVLTVQYRIDPSASARIRITDGLRSFGSSGCSVAAQPIRSLYRKDRTVHSCTHDTENGYCVCSDALIVNGDNWVTRIPVTETAENAKLRRAARYYFGGVVELTDLESGRMTVAMVRALNLYGCFVKTNQSFKLDANLILKMTHSGSQFSAKGRVVNQTEIGIGVEFTAIEPADRARLEECLADLAQTAQAAD